MKTSFSRTLVRIRTLVSPWTAREVIDCAAEQLESPRLQEACKAQLHTPQTTIQTIKPPKPENSTLLTLEK